MLSEKVHNGDDPKSIISTWIALEALSPQTYRHPKDLALGRQYNVVDITSADLPWFSGKKPPEDKKLFYQIILGSIPMAKATDELIKAFGSDEERPERSQEKAIIATVIVDKDGKVIDDNPISVSSFAWALPLVLNLKLDALVDWSYVESRMINALINVFNKLDTDGTRLPLDHALIQKAHDTIISALELPLGFVEPPRFAIRIFQSIKTMNPPEPLLLNSFYLRDLSRVAKLVDRNEIPFALSHYLGIRRPNNIVDILDNKAALEQTVSPIMFPHARWPSPGGHPLVILQQAAVNIAKAAQHDDIIAINGPPGTGKTTLLRDIIASCILDRAMAMSKFDNPEDAFIQTNERAYLKDNAYYNLYKLDESLKGYEILVASSNNKAVENISKELPALKAIGRTSEELNYFKTISDLVLNPPKNEKDDENETSKNEPIESWGLIAAVLGNSKNRQMFMQTFWWDYNRSFRSYLKAVKGDSFIDEYNTEDPEIIALENPPNSSEAKENWRKARSKFISLKNSLDYEIKKLESSRVFINCTIKEVHTQLESLKKLTGNLDNEIFSINSEIKLYEDDLKDKEIVVELNRERVRKHKMSWPGLLSRVLKNDCWKEWSSEHKTITDDLSASLSEFKIATKIIHKNKLKVTELNKKISTSEKESLAVRHRFKSSLEKYSELKDILQDRLIDECLLNRHHEVWNKASPWISNELNKKREDLFIAAMQLHKAFIDASAQKMLHNVGTLMHFFSTGSAKSVNIKCLLSDLWSSLFLVIPVISTTFASVDRMMTDLPINSLGWLLVDEAGQALPQAAVGAIMRAKKSIIVGDPLQIPPVVSLPSRLNNEICKFFKINHSAWTAPDASAQTLADQAAVFQATFRSDQGRRPVGIPLLVHRRCHEPMFGMSNRIAYDNQMVHAVGERFNSGIDFILGSSAWFNVNGQSETKYCPSEGHTVIRLLEKLADCGLSDPDIFIITPFRTIAQELRQLLKANAQLFNDFKTDQDTWIENRVGTIHTVQGREADTVILVLGAPMDAQRGARAWASNTPNIFNVAVSRARQNLYVIGSHGAWSRMGHARELAEHLPVLFL